MKCDLNSLSVNKFFLPKKPSNLPPGFPGRYPIPGHIGREAKENSIRELLLDTKKRNQELHIKTRAGFWLGGKILQYAIQFLYASSHQKLSIHPETRKLIADPKGHFIIAIWHNRLFYTVFSLPFLVARHGHDVLAIISQSKDAEFIARCTEAWGAYTARGSTTRGGKAALKKILRHTKNHFHPLITPDGPKGPRYQVQDGVLALAQMANLPIIPLAWDSKRKWVFNSWDQFMVPKPFATVYLDYGAPFFPERSASMEENREKLRNIMISQTDNLASLAGVNPIL